MTGEKIRRQAVISLNISLEKEFNSSNKRNCVKTGEEEIKAFCRTLQGLEYIMLPGDRRSSVKERGDIFLNCF